MKPAHEQVRVLQTAARHKGQPRKYRRVEQTIAQAQEAKKSATYQNTFLQVCREMMPEHFALTSEALDLLMQTSEDWSAQTESSTECKARQPRRTWWWTPGAPGIGRHQPATENPNFQYPECTHWLYVLCTRCQGTALDLGYLRSARSCPTCGVKTVRKVMAT